VDFFKSGVTRAVLHSDGKTPEDRDRLTICVMTGARVDMCDFSIHVGHGSRVDDLDGDFRTTVITSSDDSGEKSLKDVAHCSVTPFTI